MGVQEEPSNLKVEGSKFELLQNRPNPFYSSTALAYSLPMSSWVTLEIYDITGRLVEALVNESQGSGVYQAQWDPGDLPSGIYFYRLQAGDFTDMKKMIVLR